MLLRQCLRQDPAPALLSVWILRTRRRQRAGDQRGPGGHHRLPRGKGHDGRRGRAAAWCAAQPRKAALGPQGAGAAGQGAQGRGCWLDVLQLSGAAREAAAPTPQPAASAVPCCIEPLGTELRTDLHLLPALLPARPWELQPSACTPPPRMHARSPATRRLHGPTATAGARPGTWAATAAARGAPGATAASGPAPRAGTVTRSLRA